MARQRVPAERDALHAGAGQPVPVVPVPVVASAEAAPANRAADRA
jgi:hypothetical protein